jgi:hypothetical protein
MMKPILLATAVALALPLLAPSTACAQLRRGGSYENAAGGITGGVQRDDYRRNGRVVSEGGVVTGGDGNGIAGSRGCARGYSVAGCSAGSVAWDNDGNVSGERGGAVVGRNGNSASSYGSFDRDEDGDINGSCSSDAYIGDRHYSAETTFESGEGFDRDVTCSGSGCRD